MMKHLSRILLIAAVCSVTILSGCASADSTRSGGRPVNPNADPGGQGVAGSRATGANSQGTPGRP